MNYNFVLNQLGLLLLILAALVAVVGAGDIAAYVAGVEREGAAAAAFTITAAVGLTVGGAAWRFTRGKAGTLERREALLLVALSWIVGAALAAMPYCIWANLIAEPNAAAVFRSPINAYFESMSGLTTTGATVLTQIDAMPRSLLFWRALTHWVGGLGIILLFVAVLPSLGAGGRRLFRVEAAGPAPEGVSPQIRQTARILWLIYLGLTVVLTVALLLAGMNLFDAITHAFSTLGTGGFSNYDASAGHFDSPLIHWILIVFMILASANFGLYHQLIRRRWSVLRTDPEFKLYLAIIAAAGAVVTALLVTRPIITTTGEELAPGFFAALRHGVFQTVSIQTTTGFCTANFDLWPILAQGVIVMLMFIGGCAGSTAGGIKVIRVWIAFRVMLAEVERIFRPNVVRPVRIGGVTVDADLKLSTFAYILGIIILWVAGTAAIIVFEGLFGAPQHPIDFATASTSSIACLSTIGPGLSRVGAVETYAWLSAPSKVILTLLMLLGRLEVFAILVLLSPRFWRESY